jgi:hypothetical protein
MQTKQTTTTMMMMMFHTHKNTCRKREEADEMLLNGREKRLKSSLNKPCIHTNKQTNTRIRIGKKNIDQKKKKRGVWIYVYEKERYV